MWFGLGNQNSVLLEACCTGNLRKVQQALDKLGVSGTNCKGQVKLHCLALQITLNLPLPLLCLPGQSDSSGDLMGALQLTCSSFL